MLINAPYVSLVTFKTRHVELHRIWLRTSRQQQPPSTAVICCFARFQTRYSSNAVVQSDMKVQTRHANNIYLDKGTVTVFDL